MFTSQPDFFDRNTQDGKRMAVRPAKLTAPDGQQVPGVAIFNGKHLKFCITATDAIRLANDIADTLENN
ncbi:hypothetical protein [Arthrobacter sp. StoSoilB20]|uniref:hypothetical protein n=1 Tax=Arthrobacter sp. StoSoilB20 TaxID=2830995 RepID=UPI001CC6D0A2|nr:hypothetical protein [Arthrobacter sp. StoSoilB20]BCW59585.1 hypothetical protein StoSoilB20_29320 [Arthrobacter sp. StoSoilB20]